MASIILPSRALMQPLGPARLRSSHWLAKKRLRGLFALTGSGPLTFNYAANRTNLSINGSIIARPTRYGIGAAVSGSSDLYSGNVLETPFGDGDANYNNTVLLAVVPANTSSQSGIYGIGDTAANIRAGSVLDKGSILQSTTQWRCYNLGGTGIGGTVKPGNLQILAQTFLDTNGTRTFYVDGEIVAGPTSGNWHVYLGAAGANARTLFSGFTGYWDGVLLYAIEIQEALSQDEIRDVVRSPFAWYGRTTQRRIYVPSSATGGAIHNVSLTEASAGADGFAGALQLAASLAESAAAAGTLAAQLLVAGALSESAVAAGQVAAQSSVVAAIAESGTGSDSVATQGTTSSASVAESTASAGTVAAESAGESSVVESAAPAGTVAAQQASGVVLTESVAAADSMAGSLAVAAALADSSAGVESLVTDAAGVAAVAEASAADATVAGQLAASSSVSEAASGADSVAAGQVVATALAESGAGLVAILSEGATDASITAVGTPADATDALLEKTALVLEIDAGDLLLEAEHVPTVWRDAPAGSGTRGRDEQGIRHAATATRRPRSTGTHRF